MTVCADHFLIARTDFGSCVSLAHGACSIPHLVACCQPAAIEAFSTELCRQFLADAKAVFAPATGTAATSGGFVAATDETDQRAALTKRRSLLGAALQAVITAIKPNAPSAAAVAAGAGAANTNGSKPIAPASNATLLAAVISVTFPKLLDSLSSNQTDTHLVIEVCSIVESTLTAHGRSTAMSGLHAELLKPLLSFVTAGPTASATASASAAGRKDAKSTSAGAGAGGVARPLLKKVVACLCTSPAVGRGVERWCTDRPCCQAHSRLVWTQSILIR